jgi:hypothetical protein
MLAKWTPVLLHKGHVFSALQAELRWWKIWSAFLVLRLPNDISGGSEKLGPSLGDSCQCSKKASSEPCMSLLKLYQAVYRCSVNVPTLSLWHMSCL